MNKYDSPYKISIKETHHKIKKILQVEQLLSLANDIIRNIIKFINWTFNKSSKDQINDFFNRKNKKIGIHNISFESNIDKIIIQHKHIQEMLLQKDQ